jgi:hypothetical protein
MEGQTPEQENLSREALDAHMAHSNSVNKYVMALYNEAMGDVVPHIPEDKMFWMHHAFLAGMRAGNTGSTLSFDSKWR